MTKAALPHIKDPELRRMVEKTMQANQKEVDEMRSWQTKRR